MKSLYWYFKRSRREMEKFLRAYEKYEEGRSGVRRSEGRWLVG